MDILDNYFGAEMQKYITKFEQHKVYSDPSAFTFQPLIEASVKKLRIFDFDATLVKVKANIIVKNNERNFH